MTGIENPQQWQLVMELTPEQLIVVAFSPLQEQSMLLEHIPLAADSTDAAGRLHALEDAIYDHPTLLADFQRTTALIASRRFSLLPAMAPDAKGNFSEEQTRLARLAIEATFAPAHADTELILNQLAPMEATLAFEIPADVARFLRRTFHGITIEHSLAPLCRYFQVKHSGKAEGKMMVNLQPDRTDIIVLGSNGVPRLVNSYPTREPMDAFYFIMAARANAHTDSTDEIILAGDRRIRATITPLLRRYVRYVMPALFPASMFRAGRLSLAAPFQALAASLPLR